MTLEQALKDYEMIFDEKLPLMCFMGVPESDIVDVIYECIDNGSAFRPEEGVDY